MDHFCFKDGVLYAEDAALPDVAGQVGTPFYCYSSATLRRHVRVFQDAFSGLDPLICYAVKANSNLSILRLLGEMGLGADVVSAGEIRRAREAGIPPERIVFSGVGKTRAEMLLALREGIYQFNVESRPELMALAEMAEAAGTVAPVALRVNPDVDPITHAKITTGTRESKFGIAMQEAEALCADVRALRSVRVQGISVHIGSQLTQAEPFRAAFARVAGFVERLRTQGHPITTLDLGGGVGIVYGEEAPPDLLAYSDIVRGAISGLGCRLILEPGRVLVGNAGILVTEVIYVKRSEEGRTFVIVDAAMNDLLRPTLYGAHHEIVPVQPRAGSAQPVDVVGPVCESGDTFAVQRPLPPVEPGDLIAFRSCGAYGAVMASTYNSRPLCPEVLVDGASHRVIRRRQTWEEMVAGER